MSDLCEQPKETLYHYIKDQPALKGLKINTAVIFSVYVSQNGKSKFTCISKWLYFGYTSPIEMTS